jgi:hypothetical protein
LAATKQHAFGLTDDEILSLKITVSMTAGVVALLVVSIMFSFPGRELLLAITAGGIGGLMHEFAQSKGTITFIERTDGGFSLGSVSSLVLGMVAGLLVFSGSEDLSELLGGSAVPTVVRTTAYTTIQAGASTLQPNIAEIFLKTILGGLALKGISQAAASNVGTRDKFTILDAKFKTGYNDNNLIILVKNEMVTRSLVLQYVQVNDYETGKSEDLISRQEVIGPRKTREINIALNFKPESDKKYVVILVSTNGERTLDVTVSNVDSNDYEFMGRGVGKGKGREE